MAGGFILMCGALALFVLAIPEFSAVTAGGQPHAAFLVASVLVKWLLIASDLRRRSARQHQPCVGWHCKSACIGYTEVTYGPARETATLARESPARGALGLLMVFLRLTPSQGRSRVRFPRAWLRSC